MTSESEFPVGKPITRIDSFEVVAGDGPELTDEERTWPVVALEPRSDSFEVIELDSVTTDEPRQSPDESPAKETEVVLRVRCAASATAAEVSAFVEKLRCAVEGVQASTANRFPVQIILPST